MPEAAKRILDTRSLATAHRRLAQLLRPGARVLDVGCGTGAITQGIARAVGPAGLVVGLDNNTALIEAAHAAHKDEPRLSFVLGDAYDLPFRGAFDVVTASRVLQWLAEPRRALAGMVAAVVPGGRVVILDYNHEQVNWVPDPPEAMRKFYAQFLAWRAEAGLDNAIADHLAKLFEAGGLTDIRVTPQQETATRGDPQFAAALRIWADVAASRGRQMVADGSISEAQRSAAEREYLDWIVRGAQTQSLYLLAVEGTRPKPVSR